MKIQEIYDIDKVWDDIDSQFNPENFDERKGQLDYYEEIAQLSKGVTPVIVSEPPEEKLYSNDPSDNPEEHEIQSPGYRGEQRAKKNAGMPYKDYDKYSEIPVPLQHNSL